MISLASLSTLDSLAGHSGDSASDTTTGTVVRVPWSSYNSANPKTAVGLKTDVTRTNMESTGAAAVVTASEINPLLSNEHGHTTPPPDLTSEVADDNSGSPARIGITSDPQTTEIINSSSYDSQKALTSMEFIKTSVSSAHSSESSNSSPSTHLSKENTVDPSLTSSMYQLISTALNSPLDKASTEKSFTSLSSQQTSQISFSTSNSTMSASLSASSTTLLQDKQTTAQLTPSSISLLPSVSSEDSSSKASAYGETITDPAASSNGATKSSTDVLSQELTSSKPSQQSLSTSQPFVLSSASSSTRMSITSSTTSDHMLSTSNMMVDEEVKGISGGAVAGIVLGVIAILLIISAVLWLAWRRLKGGNPHLKIRYRRRGKGYKRGDKRASSLSSSMDTMSVCTDMYLQNPFRHDAMYLTNSSDRNSVIDSGTMSRPRSLLAHEDAVYFNMSSAQGDRRPESDAYGDTSVMMVPDVNGRTSFINNNDVKGSLPSDTCFIHTPSSDGLSSDLPMNSTRESILTLEIPNTSLDLWQDIVAAIKAGQDENNAQPLRDSNPAREELNLSRDMAFENHAFEDDEMSSNDPARRPSSTSSPLPSHQTNVNGDVSLMNGTLSTESLPNGVATSTPNNYVQNNGAIYSSYDNMTLPIAEADCSKTDGAKDDDGDDAASYRSFTGSELSNISGDSFDIVEV